MYTALEIIEQLIIVDKIKEAIKIGDPNTQVIREKQNTKEYEKYSPNDRDDIEILTYL